MSTGFRRGMAAVVGLLLAGGLFAAPTSGQGAESTPPSGFGLTSPSGRGGPRSLAPGYSSDVGVSVIIAPDGFIAFGDRIFPRGRVTNYGMQTQTDIPVICVIYDSTAGARVYGPETVYVASLDSGCTCTVNFPYWAPPVEERVYFDTMVTALPGDEDTSNDDKDGRFAVSIMGLGCLSYNDGTFENAISWVIAGNELTERFFAPERPLSLSRAVLWVTSFSGEDYDAEVRVYGNDGPRGCPGTQLGVWAGQFHTAEWMSFYRNEVRFDPPIQVDYDTFFVSYYQTGITPIYIYLAEDTISGVIDIGNDWGKYNPGGGSWGLFPYDNTMDFGIDAWYDAPLLDGTASEITVPEGQLDSNRTFTPQIIVENAGLSDRDSIVAEFFITSSADDVDTVYFDIANTGPIHAGETKEVTFGQSVMLDPGSYTMTSITLLRYDARPGNDTLVRSLEVGRLGLAAKENVGCASFSIAPNPLAKNATVRFNLPGARVVRIDAYDATGRAVLAQTIAAARTGTATLDLRDLQPGVYIVKVRAGGFSSTQKLVIQHQ